MEVALKLKDHAQRLAANGKQDVAEFAESLIKEIDEREGAMLSAITNAIISYDDLLGIKDQSEDERRKRKEIVGSVVSTALSGILQEGRFLERYHRKRRGESTLRPTARGKLRRTDE